MSVINDFQVELVEKNEELVELKDSLASWIAYKQQKQNLLSNNMGTVSTLQNQIAEADEKIVVRTGQISVVEDRIKYLEGRIEQYFDAVAEGISNGATEEDSSDRVDAEFQAQKDAEEKAILDAEKEVAVAKRNKVIVTVVIVAIIVGALVYFIKKRKSKKSKK